MEQYVNENTIIKNNTYELFKDLIYCPICKCLMIEPVMCLTCQNIYCKNCIEKWKAKKGNCPNRCEPNFKNVIGKNRLISKFSFRCIKGCGAEISFDDINTHYNSNCLNNNSNTVNKIESPNNEKSKMKLLTKDQTAKLKENKKIKHMSSKINKLMKFL